MKQYVKKPIPVSALQWTGKNIDKIKEFCTDSEGNVKCFTSGENLWIETREGQLKSEVRDYIMRGIEGEFYPCGEQIFLKTYDEYNEAEFHEFAHKEIPITSLHNATSNEPTPIIFDEIITEGNSTINGQQTFYGIVLENLTDDKIYGVDLFNYEHDKQDKIKYYCQLSIVSYNKLLRHLSALQNAEEEINLIRFHFLCDYKKFERKQGGSKIEFIYADCKGFSASTTFKISNYFQYDQVQSNIIDMPFDNPKSIDNKLQLRLEYLMPDTKIFISIFTKKISNK